MFAGPHSGHWLLRHLAPYGHCKRKPNSKPRAVRAAPKALPDVMPLVLETVLLTAFCIFHPFLPFHFFSMQVQKPKMTNIPSKATTTKQRIKATEMLSFKNYSHFIKLCLYKGDKSKPTDSSAMWPEKCNSTNKAALRCTETLFFLIKIPLCNSNPQLSASLHNGPSTRPAVN